MEAFSFFQNNTVVVDPWFTARDYLLGYNGKAISIKAAKVFALRSSHPDALWYVSVARGGFYCDGDTGLNRRRAFFVSLCKKDNTDMRALYMASLCYGPAWPPTDDFGGPKISLEKAASAGYFPAQVECYDRNYNRLYQPSFEDSIAYGDPHAIHVVASNTGDPIIRHNRLILAAKYGNLEAERALSIKASKTDPFKYATPLRYYMAHEYATVLFGGMDKLGHLFRVVKKFLIKRKEKYGPAVYWMGKYLLKGNFNQKTLKYAGRRPLEGLTRETALFFAAAIDHYQVCLANARLAVDVWVVIARRFRVVKDVRKMIAQLIWGERYLYASMLDDPPEEKKPKRKTKKNV